MPRWSSGTEGGVGQAGRSALISLKIASAAPRRRTRSSSWSIVWTAVVGSLIAGDNALMAMSTGQAATVHPGEREQRIDKSRRERTQRVEQRTVAREPEQDGAKREQSPDQANDRIAQQPEATASGKLDAGRWRRSHGTARRCGRSPAWRLAPWSTAIFDNDPRGARHLMIVDRRSPTRLGRLLLAASVRLAQSGRTNSIEWWETSGIPYAHEDGVSRLASQHGHVPVLETMFLMVSSLLEAAMDCTAGHMLSIQPFDPCQKQRVRISK